MRRRRLLALLALTAALLAAGATAAFDPGFEGGASTGRAAGATSLLHARDELIAPTPPTRLAAVGRSGPGGNWLAHAVRTGAALLATAALLAALASLRLGRPGGARRSRSFGTSSLGRAPPQLLAI
ncbi:MAG TPA: hypothetical protein VIA11_21550 [Acidimicrobiia bacterium]|nr:hypothetical protein [Acidimicrobiia bacterium]